MMLALVATGAVKPPIAMLVMAPWYSNQLLPDALVARAKSNVTCPVTVWPTAKPGTVELVAVPVRLNVTGDAMAEGTGRVSATAISAGQRRLSIFGHSKLIQRVT